MAQNKIDYFSRLGIVVTECRNKLFSWITKESKRVVKHSIGSLIKLKEDYYILTCYHGIKDYELVNFYSFNVSNKIVKFGCKVDQISQEMDLALLKLEVKDKPIIDYFTMDNILINLSTLTNNSKVSVLSQEYKFVSETDIQIKNNKIDTEILELIFDNQQSLNMPKLPFLVIKLHDYKHIDGLSGSPVMLNDKLVGIISNVNDEDCINIISSVTIQRFLLEFLKCNKISGLCDMIADLKICRWEEDEKSNTGFLVTNSYGKKNQDELCKNDIIYEVNNQKINNQGELYDAQLDCNVPISTFISLNYMADDDLEIKVLRQNKKSEYDQKKIVLKLLPVERYKYVPLEFNQQHIECDGLIFIELNEELLQYYRNQNIILEGSLLEYYCETPYKKKNQLNDKIIIFVQINVDNINKQDLLILKRNNLPLVNLENNIYSFPILTKINNQKIKKLDDIRGLLLEKKSLYFRVEKNLKMRLDYSENKLQQLKIIK